MRGGCQFGSSFGGFLGSIHPGGGGFFGGGGGPCAAMRTAPVVESLDTPDGTGTVMNFEDEDGHTTVIWVTPADTVEGI